MSAPEAIAWAGPDILDAAPVQRADGDLLVLDAQGGICCLDLRTQAITRLGTVALPAQRMEEEEGGRFWITPRWRLYASAEGACAAAVFDGGRHGVVVQLTEGCTVTDGRVEQVHDGGMGVGVDVGRYGAIAGQPGLGVHG